MTKNQISIHFVFVFLAFSPFIKAQFVFKDYAIHNVNIVDVKTGEILEDHSILIHEDRIRSIFRSDEFDDVDSIQNIEMKGAFVVPGLIDAHVHFATDPTTERRDNAEKVLEEMLRSGITAVRDMAGDTRALSSLSRDALIGDIDAPNLYYSSLMAGPKFFSDPRTIATSQGGLSGAMPYMKGVDSSSNLSLEVAQAIGTGAHGIKLYANLDGDLARSIVDEARKQGMPVWSHLALRPAIPSEVLNTGVISVSHVHMLTYEGYTEDEELMKNWSIERDAEGSQEFWDNEFQKLEFNYLYDLFIKHNIVLDATVTVLEKYKENARYAWLYEIGIRITREARKYGVSIAAGSDSDQETFVQHEMNLLNSLCGFSPFEALQAATLFAAQATGIDSDQGSIEVGKKANLLFLEGNPLENLENLDSGFFVIKDGKLFNFEKR